jgi:uncharacterized surface protein with fasciclin (FAS1) repeats
MNLSIFFRSCLKSLALIALLSFGVNAYAQETEPVTEPIDPPVEEAAYEEAQEAAADIVSWLQSNEDYSQLASALEQTGLAQALSTEGPFTLLAPSNDAFAALPEGTLENMDVEALTNLLRAHVVAGEVPAEQVMSMETVSAVSGDELTVGDGMIGNANIVETDIQTGNGIIHTIDAVIMPQ